VQIYNKKEKIPNIFPLFCLLQSASVIIAAVLQLLPSFPANILPTFSFLQHQHCKKRTLKPQGATTLAGSVYFGLLSVFYAKIR